MTAVDALSCEPPLSPHPAGGWDLEVSLADLPKPLDFSALFGRTAPTDVEIGSGSGAFLATFAGQNPDRNFFAIEKDRREVMRAKDKWRRRHLLNTRVVQCDALYFLEEYGAPLSVDRYIVLYSDPWPKKRHFKRRLFQPRLIPLLENTLKDGGELIIKTDVTSYYEVICELLDGTGFLQLQFDRRLDKESVEDDVMTNFQRKALEKGHPIHYFVYTKTANA